LPVPMVNVSAVSVLPLVHSLPVPELAAAVVSDDELLPPHAASRRVPVMATEMVSLRMMVPFTEFRWGATTLQVVNTRPN
jgi:hypothetical protein